MKVQKLNILIVDDEAVLTHGFKELLEKTDGYAVSVAHTGKDALSECERIRPDVVILDIGLADMDGFEIARRIRSTGTTRPFLIAMSGHSHQDRAVKEAGFNEYVIKPTAIATIQNILAQVH